MTTTLRIAVVDELVRANWTGLEDVKEHFTDEEIFEMVQRYQDQQKHALKYRATRKIAAKMTAARLAELEEMVKSGKLAPAAPASEVGDE